MVVSYARQTGYRVTVTLQSNEVPKMVLGTTQDRGLVSTFQHAPLISQRVTAFGDQPVSLTSVFKRVDLQQKACRGRDEQQRE